MALLVPPVLGMGLAARAGLGTLHGSVDSLYQDNVVTGQVTARLGQGLDDAEEVALRLLVDQSPAVRARLEAELRDRIVPVVDSEILALRRIHARDLRSERARLEQVATGWSEFKRLWDDGVLDGQPNGGAPVGPRRDRVVPLLDSITQLSAAMLDTEAGQAEVTHGRGKVAEQNAGEQLFAITTLSVLLIIGVALWLARSIVPRMLAYSRFAGRVAGGHLDERLQPRGVDELDELGRALDTMVAARQVERRYDETQAEFNDALQVADSEAEVHDLLKRHLERSIEPSVVTVLNRNNSADRLEAKTLLPTESPLRESLQGAGPKACMAVRLGRAYDMRSAERPLLSCQVCHQLRGGVTCQPLLVSGEVIGSVLVNHSRPLRAREPVRIQESVTQAAPLLANLRNLAIAEMRASTDALTGLPNNRAVQDTVKRMVAQASRTVSPLAVALLDLDHFKQINDGYGHGKGDEVLAAVGTVLRTVLRGSDFVGRYGGEEFVMLLPDTGREGALVVADSVRTAISTISVSDIDRAITVSVGVAVLPDDAVDAASVVRIADRCLYLAKSQGRNRVVTVPPESSRVAAEARTAS